MTTENYIETKYRELGTRINIEYMDLYASFSNVKLQEIFSTIHHMFADNYKAMNSRLPTKDYTAHYWADNSRELLLAIEVIKGLQRALKNTDYAFNIIPYYENIINNSLEFLQQSGGSIIPQGMEKVDIYYVDPIIVKTDAIALNANAIQQYANLVKIDEGSYAEVYTFDDPFYKRKFVLKRAKKELNQKEIERFKQEFEQMKLLSSPYIAEVYSFDLAKNEYVMEYVDYSLKDYILKCNPPEEDRRRIINQVLQAFKYIHSKGILHRDISPTNILIKEYEDVKVVKVADFGLVKIPNSDLTAIETELKGCYNDPALITEGFRNYSILHETFALTRLVAFVLTGKANADRITDAKLKAYVEKGLSSDKNKRFQSVEEMIAAYRHTL